jgi:hypothetical protein
LKENNFPQTFIEDDLRFEWRQFNAVRLGHGRFSIRSRFAFFFEILFETDLSNMSLDF